jgi:hypothetical protein
MREFEEALAAWRDAVRRLEHATDGETEVLAAEVADHRQRFQELSAQYMMDRIDALKHAEAKRRSELPSTPAFHEAAREEMDIAAEIWDTARISDAEIPATQTTESDEGSRGSV